MGAGYTTGHVFSTQFTFAMFTFALKFDNGIGTVQVDGLRSYAILCIQACLPKFLWQKLLWQFRDPVHEVVRRGFSLFHKDILVHFRVQDHDVMELTSLLRFEDTDPFRQDVI